MFLGFTNTKINNNYKLLPHNNLFLGRGGGTLPSSLFFGEKTELQRPFPL